MTTANEPVIVAGGSWSCCSARTVYVHHRDYPEAVAEGVSAELAAGHLANQPVRSAMPPTATGARPSPRPGASLPIAIPRCLPPDAGGDGQGSGVRSRINDLLRGTSRDGSRKRSLR